MQIHSRKMNVNKDDVNFEELARSTVDFNGAQLKAVCVEAGMEALRRGGTVLRHHMPQTVRPFVTGTILGFHHIIITYDGFASFKKLNHEACCRQRGRRSPGSR